MLFLYFWVCHSRGDGNPAIRIWIPAFAGMTIRATRKKRACFGTSKPKQALNTPREIQGFIRSIENL